MCVLNHFFSRPFHYKHGQKHHRTAKDAERRWLFLPNRVCNYSCPNDFGGKNDGNPRRIEESLCPGLYKECNCGCQYRTENYCKPDVAVRRNLHATLPGECASPAQNRANG